MSKHPIRSSKRTKGRLLTLFQSAPTLLLSPKVPWKMKALFVGAVLLYWVLPDLLPLLPIDDVLFTIIVIPWFAKRAAKYDTSV